MSANKLALLYDTAFEWAKKAEQPMLAAHDRYVYVREAITSFSEAQDLEPVAKNRQVLAEKLREYESQVHELEKTLKSLPEADALVQQAMERDQANDIDKAEAYYLDAAMRYLNALKKTDLLQCQKITWQARADKILNRVEEIKHLRKSSLVTKGNQELVNSLKDGYTPEEIEVLKESSWINGKLFLPFIEDDAKHESFVSGTPFKDPDGLLKLSDKQKSVFGSWMRAPQLLGSKPKMIVQVAPENIMQDIVGDCSFVSSLCIAAHHERRFRKRLITNIIYPQSPDGKPIYNRWGKYIVKLWYNGTARRIVVDDRFPVTKNSQWLCSYSRRPNELWVSIIEKAYMKLNGGFDFPGSVSGIDLYALTGWIPEVHQLMGENGLAATSKEKESTWTKLLSATDHGDVLMTVATGQMSNARANALGLVPTHAYAVLCVCEREGHRLLQLKNPWSKIRWKGKFSPFDTMSWTPALRRQLDYDLSIAQKHDNGIFWIDYDSLLESFETLYLNWNPKLFKTNEILHRSWPHNMGPRDDTFMVCHNPQFQLNVNVEEPDQGIVWVLLSRHVTDKRQLLSEDKGDFMTLTIYERRNGKRVYYPEKPKIRGVYSNNPHCLIAFQVEPGNHYYSLVVSLFEKTRSVNYTVTVYASKHCCDPAPVLQEIPEHHPYTKVTEGEWTKATAGGCPKYPTYMSNPQYKLTVHENCKDIHFRLLAPKEYPINIRVFNLHKIYDDPKSLRVDCADPKIEVGSSGQYRQGFCILELENFSKGEYTLVLSTFTPNKVGPFQFHIEATEEFEISLIPQEGDGMLQQFVSDCWSTKTGVGCQNFGRFYKNPAYGLTVEYPKTEIIARLQYIPSEGENVEWPSINLAIFKGSEIPREASLNDALVASNRGIYLNPPSGAVIPLTSIEPGEYILVPSTFQPLHGEFKISFYSSTPTILQKGAPEYVRVAHKILAQIQKEKQIQKDKQNPPDNPTRTYL